MKKTDARKLSNDELRQLRLQADRLRRETSLTFAEIAKIIGVHIGTVISWGRRFGVGRSDTALSPDSGQRGRRHGEGRTLSAVDELVIRKHVIGKNPDQLVLPFALWTRRAVQALILETLRVEMPIRTVGEYLRRWDMTPQRPIKKALEQRPAAVEQWLQIEYPKIAVRAAAEGAEIYWADETAVRQDTAWIRGYAPIGQTPTLLHSARWQSITMISAVTNHGALHFAIHEGAINTERFIDFMDRLVTDAKGKKVFLIVDNLRVHHALLVKEWLKNHSEAIEVFCLPAYTPEANPDEYLNRDLKTNLRSQEPKRDAQSLWRAVRKFLEFLQHTPERVRAYFSHAPVRYAS